MTDRNALLRGKAQDSEPRVRHTCSMGVGCEEAGVCYAGAHNEPDLCGRPINQYPRDRLTIEQKQAVADFQSTNPGILTPADYWVGAIESHREAQNADSEPVKWSDFEYDGTSPATKKRGST